MAINKLTLCVLLVFLSGCAMNKIISPKEIKVPIMYCPAPQEYTRPSLPLLNMSQSQQETPGELAKYYKATVLELQGYVSELEAQLDNYKKIHNSYQQTEQKPQDGTNGIIERN